MIKATYQREKLLFISNIVAMTMTFLFLGTFVVLFVFTHTFMKTVERQVQLTVYFKDEFPETSIKDLEIKLNQDERVSETRYVSKEDALALFRELNKEDPELLQSVTSNILPASLEIRTRRVSDLKIMAEEMILVDGVEDVKFFEQAVEKFRNYSLLINVIGLSATIIMFIISFALIMITHRITISSKGKELEILKLVGASDSYVKNPLVTQGLFFGAVSSIIASLILILVSVVLQVGGYLHTVSLGIPDLFINITAFSMLLSVLLIASGLLLGYLGSVAAVKRYLKY